MKLFWMLKLLCDSLDIVLKIAGVFLPVFIPHQCC